MRQQINIHESRDVEPLVVSADADVYLRVEDKELREVMALYNGEKVGDMDVRAYLTKGWDTSSDWRVPDSYRMELARRMGNMILLHQNSDYDSEHEKPFLGRNKHRR